MLGRQYRAKRQISPEALADFAHRHTRKLNSKALRQLSLHCAEMKAELDAGGLDPYAEFVRAADERLMLTATRSIFDEFQSIRGERRRQRALEMSGEHFLEEEEPEDEIDAEEEFVAEAEEEGESDDEYLRLARALELIRSTLGKSFFHRISMVSGDVNFVDAALASGDETLVGEVGGLDPTEALAQARDITEPFYRARSLSSVVPQLISVGRVDDAVKAAEESLAAARSCQSEDLITAYSVTVPALLSAECFTLAASAVEEVLGRTHLIASEDEKAAAMMRVTSSLMEAGALPPVVKRSLSRAILGEDIFFWGKGSVKSPLVEVILSLLSDVDDDTLIFLQKVVVHPNTDIRRSVLRTMPLGDNDHMRNMLVSHLKDADARVRIEVLERIGWSGDAKLASYLINHLRQGEAETGLEKRALALNIARLGLSRHVPFINAMLGGCASQDSRLIRVMNPIKDDADYQRAALEVMYHLGNREARRLVYNAAHKGRGTGRKLSRRLWHVIKSRPYQEPNLPRSPHDPEYSEDETFDFMGMIARFEAEHGEPPAEDDSFFGRIKSAIFGQADAEAPTPPRQKPTGPANDIEPLVETDIPHQVESVHDADETAQSAPENAEQEPAAEAPLGPVRAGLKIEAVVSQLGQRTSGSLPMQFHLYTSKTDTKAIWSEYRDQVTVTAGRFEVLLGLNRERIPGLPEKVWLAVEIDGDELEPRTELSRYRSVIQG